MIKDRSANLFIRGVPRPEVRWGSAGEALDASKRRRTKLLIFGHQKARPGPHGREKLVELPVQFMVPWDFPGRLLDVSYYVNDITQGSVEGGDGVVRWRCVG